MLANAQRDGRPAEYRWRPLLNAAVWLTPSRVTCSNAAKTRNPLTLAGVPQTNETISAASGPNRYAENKRFGQESVESSPEGGGESMVKRICETAW